MEERKTERARSNRETTRRHKAPAGPPLCLRNASLNQRHAGKQQASTALLYCLLPENHARCLAGVGKPTQRL